MKHSGFTLVETMMALVVLNIGIAIAWYMMVYSAQLGAKNTRKLNAFHFAQNEVESVFFIKTKEVNDTDYVITDNTGLSYSIKRTVLDSEKLAEEEYSALFKSELSEDNIDEPETPIHPTEICVRVYELTSDVSHLGSVRRPSLNGPGETDEDTDHLLAELCAYKPEFIR